MVINRQQLACLLALALTLCAARQAAMAQGGANDLAQPIFSFDEVTRFNLPYARTQPTIDGRIDRDEWAQAAVLSGVAPMYSNFAFGRDVTFFLMWDEEHLYLAARSPLRPGEKLRRFQRDWFAAEVTNDDVVEFAIDMLGRNTRPGESPAVLHGMINGAGAGFFERFYPYLSRPVDNWYPRIESATQLPESDNRHTWEIEWILDRDDLDLQPGSMQQVGDQLGLLLARRFQAPDVVVHIPSATGPLWAEGYPQATLTRDQPVVQVRTIDGLLRRHMKVDLALINPDLQRDAQLVVRTVVTTETQQGSSDPVVEEVFRDEKPFDIAPGASAAYQLDQAAPEMDYTWNDATRRVGQLRIEVIDRRIKPAVMPTDERDASVVYRTVLRFLPDPRQEYQKFVPVKQPFAVDCRYSPSTNTLWVAADVLDAEIENPDDVAGVAYKVVQDMSLLAEGTIRRKNRNQFQSPIVLPDLQPGSIQLIFRLIDKRGFELAKRQLEFRKIDEAKEFIEWWRNPIGPVDRVLWPFTALQVEQAGDGQSIAAVNCVLRRYELDGIGLPARITSNEKEVLSRPAQLIVRIAGIDYPLQTSAPLRLIEAADHVVRFEGQGTAAGLNVVTKGSIEQDGLVDIQLTFEPTAQALEIDELRLEWPIDDKLENSMAAIGPGEHYSVRTIGSVPKGQGVVWDTLSDVGSKASGMSIGNFIPEVWIGTEQRGLLWSADSDYGWVPLDDSPAHDIVRDGDTVTLRNFIISGAIGNRPFRLAGQRTIRFQYNASPFKPMATGWRLNQRAGSGMFAGGKYKMNWDTGASGWSLLSPPTGEKRRWPEYYAHYKSRAADVAKLGIYSPMQRLLLWTSNQVPLRGYGPISIDPAVFTYFEPDWYSNNIERLAPTWQDYAVWLAREQVVSGGAAQFHFDDAGVFLHRDAVNGSAYRLYDGQTQPAADTYALRQFAQRLTSMMQSEGYFPAGISAHATNSFPLKALPWFDAVADGEMPIVDSIDAYPPQRMIALGCPHNFGTAVNFMPYVDPRWASMHDASTVGGDGSPFDSPEFRHWGIGRGGVEFVPYWRNFPIVRRVGAGLVASLWLQPGTAVIGVTNLGTGQPGEDERPANLDVTLNLQELGAPTGLDESQVRAAELMRDMRINPRYHAHQPWFERLPAVDRIDGEPVKLRPAGGLTLNARTGQLSGLPIHYHDTRYIVIAWSPSPPSQRAIDAMFPPDARDAAWWWWANQPDIREVDNFAVEAPIVQKKGNLTMQAWQREGRVLIRLANPDEQLTEGVLSVDLAQLGIGIDPRERLWQQFTQIYDLQDRQSDAGRPLVFAGSWASPAELEASLGRRDAGTVLFDGHLGLVAAKLAPGDVRVISLDLD